MSKPFLSRCLFRYLQLAFLHWYANIKGRRAFLRWLLCCNKASKYISQLQQNGKEKENLIAHLTFKQLVILHFTPVSTGL